MSIRSTGLSDHERSSASGDGSGRDNPYRPVSAKEAAAAIGCNVKGIYEGMRTGQIPCFRVGKLMFIPRPAFESLLRDGAAKKPADRAA
jgi:hypothetical protein